MSYYIILRGTSITSCSRTNNTIGHDQFEPGIRKGGQVDENNQLWQVELIKLNSLRLNVNEKKKISLKLILEINN